MASWSWSVGSAAPATSWKYPLGQARSRRIVWQLDGGAYATFTEDGRSPEALVIGELTTDLACWRDAELLFRGRIGSQNDELSENVHSSTFYAIDYRGMLEFRKIDELGRSYVGWDPAAIAWDLIDDTQTKTGGDWGINPGLGTTSGNIRTIDYNPGKSIKEAITDLGQADGGFDWEISPALELNMWHPERGGDNGVILQFGSSVLRAHRSINPTDFANAVIQTGTKDLDAVRLESPTLATDPRGLWEDSESKTTFASQPELQARAQWRLDRKSALRGAVRMMLMPGFWEGKDHLWLGDIVTVSIKSGRLNFHESYKVVEIAIDPGTGVNSEQVDVMVVPV